MNGVVKAVVPISDGGKTLSLANLDVGSYDFEAAYPGDANYNAEHVHVYQAVNKADVTLSLAININPSQYGVPVAFNAALSKAGATGKASFFDGTRLLGTVTISDRSAWFTASDLSAGDHEINAKYSFDGNYNSESTSVLQTVDAVYTVHYVQTK